MVKTFMIERVTLGSTPCDEPCAQVGTDNYYEEAKKRRKNAALT